MKILILSDYCPANYLFYRYLSLLRRLRSTFPKTWWKDGIRALDNVIIFWQFRIFSPKFFHIIYFFGLQDRYYIFMNLQKPGEKIPFHADVNVVED